MNKTSLNDEQLLLSPLVSVFGKNKRYADYVNDLFKVMPDEKQTILHAAVGVAGEAGELLDAVKKSWAYGKELDVENVKEEIGDALFYLQALCNVMGYSMAECLQANADKLSIRYGEKYSDAKAIDRADKKVIK